MRFTRIPRTIIVHGRQAGKTAARDVGGPPRIGGADGPIDGSKVRWQLDVRKDAGGWRWKVYDPNSGYVFEDATAADAVTAQKEGEKSIAAARKAKIYDKARSRDEKLARGDIVKYSRPTSAMEAKMEFVVLEANGIRTMARALNTGLTIAPIENLDTHEWKLVRKGPGPRDAGRFTKSMIEQLRTEYGRIKRIDPAGESYKKLISMMSALGQEDLKQLAASEIPFVSSLARNRTHDAKTFIQVLNDPEGRRLVDAIEDTLKSLRNRTGGDPTLEAILKNQVAELKRKTGFTYQVNDAGRARFHVYEVEHGGDEQSSIDDLTRAGCKNVKVLGRNYDAGMIAVECDLPAGMTSKQQLAAKLSYAVIDAKRPRSKDANQYSSRPFGEALALGSPSGSMSGAALKRAQERVRVGLFGKGGLQKEPVAQPGEKASLLRQAKELRELAARGMKPRAHIAKAEELERRAATVKDVEVGDPVELERAKAIGQNFATSGMAEHQVVGAMVSKGFSRTDKETKAAVAAYRKAKGTKDADTPREGATMMATINGRRIKVRVIGVDSDPRARVWVVEVDDPDKDHFLPRTALSSA